MNIFFMISAGGYDGNDVVFTWLRGNDSVRGLENLRLSQYTVERYYTLVTRSQQETGKAGNWNLKNVYVISIYHFFFPLCSNIFWAERT